MRMIMQSNLEIPHHNSCLPLLSELVEKYEIHFDKVDQKELLSYVDKVDYYLCVKMPSMKKGCRAFYDGEGKALNRVLQPSTIRGIDINLAALLQTSIDLTGEI